jgi:HK97 gp10 family phage protein
MKITVTVVTNQLPVLPRVVQQVADEAVRAAALAVEAHAKQVVPVRTGNLRASIRTWQEGPSTWACGTNMHYAPYVEFGTRYMAARPYLAPAAEAVRQRLPSGIAEAIRRALGQP